MESAYQELSLDDYPKSIDPDLVKRLVNIDHGVLGRTVSTKSHPNTSGAFYFWLSKNAAEARAIDIGSIVVAFCDDGRDLVFAAVNELRSYSDSETFIHHYIEHDYGEPDTHVNKDLAQIIVGTCAVVRTLSSKTRPVTPSRVFFPTALGIQFSFGIVDSKGKQAFRGAAIPLGIYENTNGEIAPVSVDENYLVGPEAAHLNISGISGLACKTSALEFGLKSLLCHTSKKVGVLVMNVKSKDLLYLDQLNSRMVEDAWSRKVYQSLNMPVEPFTTARFFAPASPRQRSVTQSLRLLPTELFRWDLNMIYQDLPALFSSFDWDANTEGAWYVVKEAIELGHILSYEDMITWIDKLLSISGLTEWPRGFPTATWQKLKSDLRRFTIQYRGLITEEARGVDIPWDDLRRNSVFVVDIQMLSDGGQKLVFGRCIRSVTQLLESRTNRLDAVIVFVDELNKFAPKAERTSLKSQLVEVTARGRSLGLILFGAEQFASAVEKQIVENSSTFMFGRTESTEMETANYSGLTDEMKAKLRMLPQGQLLIKFPKFPQPIFVKFPFPPCLPGDDYDIPTRVSPYEAYITPDLIEAGEESPSPTDIAADIGAPRREDMPVRHMPPPMVVIEPGSLLRRYNAGEREAVWADMMALGAQIRVGPVGEDAAAVARETMRRARSNIETIVMRLDQMDYRFAPRPNAAGQFDASKQALGARYGMKQMLQGLAAGRPAPKSVAPDHLQDKNVFLPSSDKDAAVIARLEQKGILLPLSLKAWLETVGRIDLTGSHATLCFMEDQQPWGTISLTAIDGRKTVHPLTRPVTTIGRSRVAGNDIPLDGDDMVSKQHALIEHDFENRVTVHDLGSTNGVSVNGVRVEHTRLLMHGDEVTIGSSKMLFQMAAVKPQLAVARIYSDPLTILPTASVIAEKIESRRAAGGRHLDVLMSFYDADKAVPDSGELIEEGYTLTIPNASADALLVGERHNTTFVDYLRIAFRWGGFPGWERYKNRPEADIAKLCEGLLPI